MLRSLSGFSGWRAAIACAGVEVSKGGVVEDFNGCDVEVNSEAGEDKGAGIVWTSV